MIFDESKLNRVLEKTIDNKNIFGAVVNIESVDNNFSWIKSAGNLDKDSQYAIASITKMYTTAVILRLRLEGALLLENKISEYLSRNTISKLHIYKGKEYSDLITINHLLSHTSGLPDYYEEKDESGKSIAMMILHPFITNQIHYIDHFL